MTWVNMKSPRFCAQCGERLETTFKAFITRGGTFLCPTHGRMSEAREAERLDEIHKMLTEKK